MDRQFEEGFGLFLPNQNGRALDVLSAHLPHVAGPLSGVEQQIEGQPFP